MESLKIHFLNVGHGDCTVLEHPSGRISIVDVHNGTELDKDSEDEVLAELGWSGLTRAIAEVLAPTPLTKNALLERAGYKILRTNPVQYISQKVTNGSIFRFILTHPEMDHMRGLAALQTTFGIENFWDTENTKKNHGFHPFLDDETDWAEYRRFRDGSRCKVLNLYRGSTGPYYSKDDDSGGLGDGIEILSPTPQLVQYANDNDKWNELSYVLRVTYGGRSVILGGDACQEAWTTIYAAYGSNLKCDILKASHHGRESGFHGDAVEAMNPQLTVLSVGKKPETDNHQEYKKYSKFVWSTRWKGNVVVTITADGGITAESEYNNTPLGTNVPVA